MTCALLEEINQVELHFCRATWALSINNGSPSPPASIIFI
jgi:hypothetical protein